MTRSIVQEIRIGAGAAAVWEALSTAQGLEQWFPLRAEVEPGEGGSIFLSWGEGAEGRAAITAWEAGKRMRWEERSGDVAMVVDFLLEPAGEGTLLRLVHSGFGSSAEFDEQYHQTAGGWKYFLLNLQQYLELHAGKLRGLISVREQRSLTGADAFGRLLRGFGLEATLSEGTAYEGKTAAGDVFRGEVKLANAPVQFAATVSNISDALLFIEIERAGADAVRPAVYLSTYGLSPARVAELQTTVRNAYEISLQDT